MNNRINAMLFSTTGASYAVAAVGVLSAIVTLFVDVSQSLSIKWLLFLIWLSITIFLCLMKIISDLIDEKKPPSPYEIPFRYLPESKIFLIRQNNNFSNQIIVAGYSVVDEVEKLQFLGNVHLVQDMLIQIMIVHVENAIDFDKFCNTEMAKQLIIRPVVPWDALKKYSDGSTQS